MSMYRIMEKRNMTFNGRKITHFKHFVQIEDDGDYILEGTYSAPGWDRSDADCHRFAIEWEPTE